MTLRINELSKLVEDAVSADGSNIGMNNKAAAGQLVPHAHVHIIPSSKKTAADPCIPLCL
ncbi:HIT domain-containing protein [Methanococcoides methylutens]|uniref:HIT domain-containing protein n=1 Tax=Methanococcoides methylutens TaxID=2226 RepID=UPI0009DEF923